MSKPPDILRPNTLSEGWRPQTQMVRGGIVRSGFRETSEAIYMTSGYVYDNAEEAEEAFKGARQRFVYSRYGNPTVAMLEERMRLIEGAEACRAVASGMAAVFAALLSHLKAGDRLVASRALFGSCSYICGDLLPRYGVETAFVDGADLDQWARALSKPAQAVFLETPANPTLEIIDLSAVCDLAHKAGAIVVVDNVFATPVLQKPLQLGADVVVYSATKHIDGQGRCMGGAILANADFVADELTPILRHTGPSMSPMNAWTLLKGIDTLDLRVRRQCDNAESVADLLGVRNDIAHVAYPFRDDHKQQALAKAQMERGGTIVTFEIDGGKPRAFRFMNALNLIDISNNLGDSKSLITHPTTTTHQRLSEEERLALGITPGLIRLSVGLEDVEDLKEDLVQALAA